MDEAAPRAKGASRLAAKVPADACRGRPALLLLPRLAWRRRSSLCLVPLHHRLRRPTLLPRQRLRLRLRLRLRRRLLRLRLQPRALRRHRIRGGRLVSRRRRPVPAAAAHEHPHRLVAVRSLREERRRANRQRHRVADTCAEQRPPPGDERREVRPEQRELVAHVAVQVGPAPRGREQVAQRHPVQREQLGVAAVRLAAARRDSLDQVRVRRRQLEDKQAVLAARVPQHRPHRVALRHAAPRVRREGLAGLLGGLALRHDVRRLGLSVALAAEEVVPRLALPHLQSHHRRSLPARVAPPQDGASSHKSGELRRKELARLGDVRGGADRPSAELGTLLAVDLAGLRR